MWLLLLLGCFVALASAKPAVVSDARSLENTLYEFLEAKQVVDESLSNVIGTPCSDKLDDAQLDILIGIDITSDQDSLDQFTNAVIKQLSRLSIPGKQSKPFKGSCVGVFTYDTAFTDMNDISDCDGFDSIFDTLYHNIQQGTYNQVADLSVPLDHAYDVFADLTSSQLNRKRVLILASAQGPSVESNAVYKAKLLKDEMNAFVIGVTLYPVDEELRPTLVQVVSPGQLLDVYEGKLDDHFTKTFTYGNCRCPRQLTQLAIYDPASNHVDNYADCFEVVKAPTNSFMASKACKDKGGSLVAVTSQEKFDFLQEVVIGKQLPSAQNYSIGLFRQRNKSLVWEYYNSALVPLGSFQKWSTSQVPKGGFCGYMTRYTGSQYGFSLGICNERFPYVCQIHACDAENQC